MTSVNLTNSVGPIFWGFVVTTFLTGVAISQGFYYFRKFGDDTIGIKLMVASLVAFTLAETALSSQLLNYFLIIHFGNIDTLHEFTPSFCAEMICTMLSCLIGQIFFADQIRLFNWRAWPLSAMISLSALSGFGFGVAGVWLQFSTHLGLYGTTPKIEWTIGTSLGSSLLSTLLACLSLFRLLATSRIAEDYEGQVRMNSVVDVLVKYTVHRGVLVSLVQSAYLATYLVAPAKPYWVPIHLVLGKVYINTLCL
ncbi:hypothetical protein SISSUDRAFT_123345 [Sistotremastrum suecicum HHB10207 ss-3]|uniref:DUF6534 domain-containing protein n=1 Tax=Sistotremastrum suecicum HHB10207 ss-3 TaxID=1314776 RepID=A0A166B065_9AGAM|nr:hypothetical protein SISSUDRAFT_123345 [Sistotremastrum suecicum HHB10207 ss-3]